MLRVIRDWLDERTGYRRVLIPIRRRVLPGPPSLWYAAPNCLVWLLVIQVLTGLVLMATYSPSTAGAWASVHFIEQDAAGAFLRGLHYFTAQALLIVSAVYGVRILLSGAFRAPRELIWFTGVLLVPLLMVWAQTGNPLPGTQKGIAQIEVEGNIVGSAPVAGPFMQRLLIGGSQVGQLTLTHLYLLHAAVWPLAAGALLVVHVSQIYRHGLSPSRRRGDRGARPYWPYQTVRNMVVLAVVLGTIAVLSLLYGAPLDAPADPQLSHIPRPEWYFRALFELRRYFSVSLEFVATMVVPSAILVWLLAVPLIDKALPRRASAAVRWLTVLAGVAGWAGLTMSSFERDWNDDEYLASAAQSTELASRARELADRGPLPPEGAVVLLREDPKTQGPLLFVQHCASCHSHTSESGEGIEAEEPSAANLYRFASADWIEGLLDAERIAGPDYFGNTKFAEGEMVATVESFFDGVEGEEAAELKKNLAKVARTLSAEAGLPSEESPDQESIDEGIELMTSEFGCTDCHRFREHGDLGSAPDLTGYGSREWLIGMISDPEGERFYPDSHNDRMPAFAPDPNQPQRNLLNSRELGLLVDWFRGQWYEANGQDGDSSEESSGG